MKIQFEDTSVSPDPLHTAELDDTEWRTPPDIIFWQGSEWKYSHDRLDRETRIRIRCYVKARTLTLP